MLPPPCWSRTFLKMDGEKRERQEKKSKFHFIKFNVSKDVLEMLSVHRFINEMYMLNELGLHKNYLHLSLSLIHIK